MAGTHAFNEAAARARGRWIAPLDQDDEWDDDHLLVLLRTAQQARAELVYGRMRAILDGSGNETWFGTWPPVLGDFGFQAALYHADLRGFRYEVGAALVDEPADWHLARRMWEAGVRFHFLPRSIGTYHTLAPTHPASVGGRSGLSSVAHFPSTRSPSSLRSSRRRSAGCSVGSRWTSAAGAVNTRLQ